VAEMGPDKVDSPLNCCRFCCCCCIGGDNDDVVSIGVGVNFGGGVRPNTGVDCLSAVDAAET
jgi:hypothetical protein